MSTAKKNEAAYRMNPKTLGSGIICAIPQTGSCPNKCHDCFFQSGRSYLEPLAGNLPNLPPCNIADGLIVRVNDGNDSNIDRRLVVEDTACYKDRFFNTAIPHDLEEFPAPVVLTVNPGAMTDTDACLLDPIPDNLMFVRFRANTWNVELLHKTIVHYTHQRVPVVVTFMAYYTEPIHPEHEHHYEYKQRTLNVYHTITQRAWNKVMVVFLDNPYVYSCGKDAATFSCSRCGNCVREYMVTKERLQTGGKRR